MPDFRKQPPGRVHHVAIVVKSIEESLGLYRDLLGLPLETVMDIETGLCVDCGEPIVIEMRDGRLVTVEPASIVGHLNWGFGPSRGKPPFL